MVNVSGGLVMDVGAEAATTIPQAFRGRKTPLKACHSGPKQMVRGDLNLALRLKEVELENKTKEVTLMHLRIRAMELDSSQQCNATSSPVSKTSDNFSCCGREPHIV